jgi:hypothetical protein
MYANEAGLATTICSILTTPRRFSGPGACPGAKKLSWPVRVVFLIFPVVSGIRRPSIRYADRQRVFHEPGGQMGQSALRVEELCTSQDVSHLEDLIAEFREMLPDQCGTAQAIDRKEPWEQVAVKAVEDGYIELADQFNKFVEICLRRVA